MNITKALMVATLIGGSGTALHAQVSQLSGTSFTQLQRHDLGTPGREVIQARGQHCPRRGGAEAQAPGEEVIFVLEGALEYTVEGKAPVTLRTGDVLFIPAGTVHSARNTGTAPGSELATYIVEKGKPLLVPVE